MNYIKSTIIDLIKIYNIIILRAEVNSEMILRLINLITSKITFSQANAEMVLELIDLIKFRTIILRAKIGREIIILKARIEILRERINLKTILRLIDLIKRKIIVLRETYALLSQKIKLYSQVILKIFNLTKSEILIFIETHEVIITKMKISFQIFLKVAHKVFINILKIFRIFVIIRMILTWFPGFNTGRRPLIFIVKLTRIYLGIFRNTWPKLFGIDVSALLALIWLRTLIRICS